MEVLFSMDIPDAFRWYARRPVVLIQFMFLDAIDRLNYPQSVTQP